MNNFNQPEIQQNNNNGSNRSKQIIFILVVYILLVMSSKFGNKNQTNTQQKLITIMKSQQIPKISTLFGIFQVGSLYQGHWQKILRISNQQYQFKKDFILRKEGKSKIQFSGIADNQINFGLLVQNGQYVDDGYIYSAFNFKNQDQYKIMKVKRQKNSAIFTIEPQNNQTLPTSTYKIQQIFNTIDMNINIINKVIFNFTLSNQNSLYVDSEIYTEKFSLKFNIVEKENLMIRTILFAVLAFVVSYFAFNSVLKILKRIIQGSQSAQKYSLISVLIATLWDSVLCLVCFIQAFSNEQNLILFILPSFMLCILFTNLQLRWMLSIFQSNYQQLGLRSIICRFNIISYGSFLLIYPILLFTNLNIWLFISISFIFLPQIYNNAQKGIRPDLNHPYYSKFLMFRFLIIFYVRGFPYNIFELRPDYLLCLICLLLLAGQYAILWIQKIYGPKKVIPNFLLPPVFNYKLEQQFNIQEGNQIPECAICLTSLHQDPDMNDPSLLKNQYDSKLMKTPCNHKYHTRCLIEWMNIKKQCPQCRTVLPPFQ